MKKSFQDTEQKAQKSRIATWLMRQIAEPDLKRMARQAAHTAHERTVEHDVPKQLTLDGLRLDVPYAYHYGEPSHHETVHNTSIIPLTVHAVQWLGLFH